MTPGPERAAHPLDLDRSDSTHHTLIPRPQGFLAEIANRNSDDRRKLYYGHRALSVAYELMHVLHAHNQQLLRHLQAADKEEGLDRKLKAVAHAFLNFAHAETCVWLCVLRIWGGTLVDRGAG